MPTHLNVNGIFQLPVWLLIFEKEETADPGGETDIVDVEERDVFG